MLRIAPQYIYKNLCFPTPMATVLQMAVVKLLARPIHAHNKRTNEWTHVREWKGLPIYHQPHEWFVLESSLWDLGKQPRTFGRPSWEIQRLSLLASRIWITSCCNESYWTRSLRYKSTEGKGSIMWTSGYSDSRFLARHLEHVKGTHTQRDMSVDGISYAEEQPISSRWMDPLSRRTPICIVCWSMERLGETLLSQKVNCMFWSIPRSVKFSKDSLLYSSSNSCFNHNQQFIPGSIPAWDAGHLFEPRLYRLSCCLKNTRLHGPACDLNWQNHRWWVLCV